jgi:hypothetical protein
VIVNRALAGAPAPISENAVGAAVSGILCSAGEGLNDARETLGAGEDAALLFI